TSARGGKGPSLLTKQGVACAQGCRPATVGVAVRASGPWRRGAACPCRAAGVLTATTPTAGPGPPSAEEPTLMLDGLQSELIALLQIIVIDVVLAGDNAIVVGMAASRVAPELRAKVIFWGI